MELKKGEVCPVCESGKLEEKCEDIKFEYKGSYLLFPNEKALACGKCGESFFDPKRNREIEKELTDHRRKTDGLLTSEEIKAIREMFGMTQVKFAELLGVGEKNFARYESGQTTQSKSMDHLLRVLMHRPEVMSLINRRYKLSKELLVLTQVIDYKSRLQKWKFENDQEDTSCSLTKLAVNYG
jgi:HTH-type transcriptional regulator / antitoxin MqsA